MHRPYCWFIAVLILFYTSIGIAGTGTAKYDLYFHKYSKMYFGYNIDYKWFKAQGIVESNLIYDAVSWAGAAGIMQIMPATWRELCEKLEFKVDGLFDPEHNIAAGIYYNFYLWNFWSSERPIKDKLSFVFASYNGGAGNVHKAQKQCNIYGSDCNLWDSVRDFADKVESWRYQESLDYVDRIFRVKMTLDEAEGIF